MSPTNEPENNKISGVMRFLNRIISEALLCVFVLILIDTVLRLYFRATIPVDIESRATADAYQGATWTWEYFDELSRWTVRWSPFIEWIDVPLKTKYVNIDDRGVRLTIPGKCSGYLRANCIRIFMFGGSTMFGEGARDAYTIPSWLQRLLDRSPYVTQIIKFGQDGYVSSQEMLLLLNQLKAGNMPQLVVFYDGYNDTISAMINGTAGVSYGNRRRAMEFNIFNQWAENDRILYKEALFAFAMNSGFGKLAKRTLVLLEPSRFQLRDGELISTARKGEDIAGGQAGGFEESVVNSYLANRGAVEVLGRGIGFKSLFFWQPCVWTKDKLTAYEARQHGLPGEKEFLLSVYRRMAETADREHVHDLSEIFRVSAKPYFIDEAHISEAGNAIVAQAMLPYVLQALKEITAPGQAQSPPSAGRMAVAPAFP